MPSLRQSLSRPSRRRFHGYRLAVAGIVKTELPGVQRDRFGALDWRFNCCRLAGPRLCAAVERVAQDRIAAMGALHPQLVHPSGQWLQFEQRAVGLLAEHSHRGDRFLTG